jgi:hypothetical protein
MYLTHFTNNVQAAKQREVDAVRLAEDTHFEQALALLNEALQHTPENPSIFNNKYAH